MIKLRPRSSWGLPIVIHNCKAFIDPHQKFSYLFNIWTAVVNKFLCLSFVVISKQHTLIDFVIYGHLFVPIYPSLLEIGVGQFLLKGKNTLFNRILSNRKRWQGDTTCFQCTPVQRTMISLMSELEK